MNYREHQKEFQQSVAAWLARVAERPGLRQKSFLTAYEATETCEDRVTLSWNAMQTAQLEDDVESGVYDGQLPQLVTLARGLFQLNVLDKIAKEKIRVLARLPRYQRDPDSLDDVEVYLVFQVKLCERFASPLNTLDMQFFEISNVSQADLDGAVLRVQQEEAADFADYLATDWPPREALLKRLDPDAYALAEEQLVEAMGEEFQKRLSKHLSEVGPSGAAGAERTFGAQIRVEIAREIKGALTRQVLRDRELEHALDAARLPGG